MRGAINRFRKQGELTVHMGLHERPGSPISRRNLLIGTGKYLIDDPSTAVAHRPLMAGSSPDQRFLTCSILLFHPQSPPAQNTPWGEMTRKWKAQFLSVMQNETQCKRETKAIWDKGSKSDPEADWTQFSWCWYSLAAEVWVNMVLRDVPGQGLSKGAIEVHNWKYLIFYPISVH